LAQPVLEEPLAHNRSEQTECGEERIAVQDVVFRQHSVDPGQQQPGTTPHTVCETQPSCMYLGRVH